jgi:plastocyanin
VTKSIVGLAALALAACAADPRAATRGADRVPAKPSRAAVAAQPAPERAPRPRRVDPRKGGLEIVLGEWAVTPEAPAIRPGKVTFAVSNRGTMGHGYEMELEGDSSGHGSGDLFKAESELVRPGESTRMTVTLPPGLYEIECLVDGHDDMGMKGVLEVRADAPFVRVSAPRRPGRISISEFAFQPSTAVVPVGTEVVWTNEDPAEHTVTSADGGFGSDVLGTGQSFSRRFDERGTYEYRCAIHPEMTGKVEVE